MYRPRILLLSVLSKFVLITALALLSGCGGGGSVQQPPPTPTPTALPDKPPIGSTATITLTATPQVVTPGSLVTLSWTATNASSITFFPALPPQEDLQPGLPTGSLTFAISQTTTYAATVTDSAGKSSTSSPVTI